MLLSFHNNIKSQTDKKVLFFSVSEAETSLSTAAATGSVQDSSWGPRRLAAAGVEITEAVESGESRICSNRCSM